MAKTIAKTTMTDLKSLCIAGLISLEDSSAEKLRGGSFDVILRSADGQKTRQRFNGQNQTANIDVPEGTTAIRLQNRDEDVGDFRFSFTGDNGLSSDAEVTTLLPRGPQSSRVTLSDGTAIDMSTGPDGVVFPVTQVRVTQF